MMNRELLNELGHKNEACKRWEQGFWRNIEITESQHSRGWKGPLGVI